MILTIYACSREHGRAKTNAENYKQKGGRDIRPSSSIRPLETCIVCTSHTSLSLRDIWQSLGGMAALQQPTAQAM